MVKVKEVIILRDLSLLDEKIGMFKIRKLLFIGFGVMMGYSMISSGSLVGIPIIIAFVILAMMPDRSITAEHRILSMLYYNFVKPKPQNANKTSNKKGGIGVGKLLSKGSKKTKKVGDTKKENEEGTK